MYLIMFLLFQFKNLLRGQCMNLPCKTLQSIPLELVQPVSSANMNLFIDLIHTPMTIQPWQKSEKWQI